MYAAQHVDELGRMWKVVACFKALPRYLLRRIWKDYDKTPLRIASLGLTIKQTTFRITSRNVVHSIAALKNI